MEQYIDVRSFSAKLDLYKLCWIFMIGSVFGFVSETIWCSFMHDRLEWHSSLIFIPFTAVYGCGSLIMYLVAQIINRKKVLQIFIFGAAACTMVEYLCSFLQEKFFGTVSWDYSNSFLNINGRVCLLLSLGWGLLSLLWVFAIQPVFEGIISNIPARIYKKLTLISVFIILIFAVISIAAVSRWVMRQSGVPSNNIITYILDKFFTDDFMKWFYPKMIFNK